MDIRVTTKGRIMFMSDGFGGSFTLKTAEGARQETIKTNTTSAIMFANWVFAAGSDKCITATPCAGALVDFELCFVREIKELEIRYKDENNVTHSRRLKNVKHVYMKKETDNSLILNVDGKTEESVNHYPAATQVEDARQIEKERLTNQSDEITTISNDIDEEITKLEAEIEDKRANIIKAAAQIEELKAEKESKEKDLIKLNKDLTDLEKTKADIEAEIEDKEAEIIKATADNEKLSGENKAKEEQLIALNEEHERLESVEEMLTLDIEKTRKIVDTMKERLADDLDSVELMDDLFKQKKSITARIQDIFKDIESVEKGLGFVARFQEKIAYKVNIAVADNDGDGYVDQPIEVGKAKHS